MHSTSYRSIVLDRLRTGILLLLASLVLAVRAGAQEMPRENAEEQQSLFERMLEQGQEDEGAEASGEDVHGRSFWLGFQRSYPFDVVPAGAHKAAIGAMEAMQRRMSAASAKSGAALFAANQWQQVGPTNVGGRVRAVAVHPSDPETIFVGGAAGGVWKTTDGGLTWRTTFDKQSALTIGSIAIDPTNPNNVYVGTGELRVGSDIGFMADGVFKSTDGGETWRNAGLNTLSAISGIVVHKDRPNIVYLISGRQYVQPRYASGNGLGTGRGFYRSSDGGATWKQSYDGEVLEIAVNPANNDEVLISTINGVQRSTDAGEHFDPSQTGLQNLGATMRMSMTFNPVSPTTVWLLQAYRSGNTHAPMLYKSNNSGQSWTSVPTLSASFFRTQGDYNNCIAIDPNDTTIMLAGGIDLWRSTNAGAQWENVTNTRGSSGDVGVAHPDQHIIRFDPTVQGVVYVGSDGGVYQSFNSGQSFRRLHAALPITQFHTVELDQTRPYRLYGGTQDNQTQGGFGSATSHTAEWDRLLGGDGFWVAVDRTNPDIVYAESQFGEMRRIDANNLDAMPANILNGISADAGGWSTPLLMSPVDNMLYSARTQLYRTANPRAASVTWQTLRPGFANQNSKATALALSPSDAGKIIVASESGDVRFTTNNGVTWTRSSGTPSRFPTDLLYDPLLPTRVYATFSGFRAGHVYVSNDNGARFTDISANLPDVPVNAIAIDPANSLHLFAGTDIGVWTSLDGGTAWFPFNEGLPVVPVADMQIHRTRRVLVAATHGRSMFEVPIDGITMPAILLAPVGGQTFATPGTITVRWTGFNGPVNVLMSYRTGEPYTVVASGVTGSSVEISVPLARSTTASVKVESVAGGQSASSGSITLNAASNVETIGTRGFIAEAIAMRQGQIWATDRASDTIRRLRTPLVSVVGAVVRSGFSGSIRDLEYDAQADVFYALVTDDDFANPKIYRMDTTGAAIGTVVLPPSITAVSGITVSATGLALATPGAGGRIVVIDVTSGAEVSSSPYASVRGDWRRGLVWNGTTYTQGVVRTDAVLDFPSEIQRLSVTDSARLYQALPVVLSTAKPVYFFDLAVDNTSSQTTAAYYATDTAGVIYRFRGELFSGIATGFAPVRSGSVTLGRVSPNPLRSEASVSVTLSRGATLTLELLTPAGERAARVFEGRLEEGAHDVRIDARLLASGLYYLVATSADGERTVAPLVVTK